MVLSLYLWERLLVDDDGGDCSEAENCEEKFAVCEAETVPAFPGVA